ncbi:MAG: glycosyltransferase family 39 protein [Chloroflexi bacterium]|nr:glycosyltransferase family 39 protein [Chloroflexota bacterium]
MLSQDKRTDAASARLMVVAASVPSARRATLVVAVALALAAAYWTWFALAQRSIVTDDGISILAAESILEHGYPLLPSGYVYERGILPHYILAASLGVFGVNDLSITLPSLAFALGALWLAYLIGRDIIGRRWVGIAAAAVLLILQAQTVYATSPRFYMPLQFFTLLAVYSGWRGYVHGSVVFQALTIGAIVAAILSQAEGAALAIAIPASVTAILLVRRQKLLTPRLLQIWAVGVILAAAAWFNTSYSPFGSVPLITAHSGIDPGHVAPKLIEPVRWARHLLSLELSFPHGFWFMPLAVMAAALAARSERWRWLDENNGAAYLLIVFAICAAALTVALSTNGARFWLFILPLYALLACVGAATLLEALGISKNAPAAASRFRAAALGLLLAGVVMNIAFVAFVSVTRDTPYTEIVMAGYGPPCQTDVQYCHRDIKASYEELSAQMNVSDAIISTNPWVTRYYLGRVDGFLRERQLGDGSFSTFEETHDEYFGVPIIDTAEELEGLKAAGHVVWVIQDAEKQQWAISERMQAHVDAAFQRVQANQFLTAHVSCADSAQAAACSTVKAPLARGSQ